MRTRIQINLLFFAVVGVVMTIWAITTIISIDALKRPFPVTAEFAGAPGLRPDLEVSYLGVRVGKIGRVRLRPGKVDVGLDIDRGSKVPSNVGARVLRKSAIGEPFVELSSPAGPAERPLKAGDHIPLSRTTSTVEYKRFFDAASRLLSAVRPEDARILVNEIAAGLDGRSQSLRDTLADASQLTGTLAANAGLLDELSTELTKTTRLLADHREGLRSGANSLALFTAALRASRSDLTKVLNGGPGFLGTANEFLNEARPGLSCLLSAAGAPGPPLLTPKASRDLTRGAANFPRLEKVVNDVVVKRSAGDAWLRATFVVSIAGPIAAEEYATPTPKPVTGPLAYCRAAGSNTGTTAPRTVTSRAPAKANAPQDPDAGPDGVLTPVAGNEIAKPPPSTTERLLPMLPVALAAAVLLGVVAQALAAARRRRSL